MSLSYSEENEFSNPFRYIYCVVNTDTQRKTYFEEKPLFAFDYNFYKIELVRVERNSDEFESGVANSLRIKRKPIIF
jgi:hypothetical protein